MASRSFALLPSTAAVLSASLAYAGAPAVPPVASIPVAPAASPARSAPQPAAAASTPPLVAMAEETPRVPVQQATEGAPVSTLPASAPHVVLVDELPYRATHPRARELPEHGSGHHAKKHGRHGRPYHPAPGVVVDVVDARGEADGAELQRAVRNGGYWPFRHCYEDGLRRDQALSGKVELDVALSGSGSVDHAGIATDGLKDESVALCVAREAAHLKLPAAKGTARVEVALSTGDEPVPEPHPVAHARELREALRASWPAVEKCYQAELAKHPEAGGRLELRFRAKSDGKVVEVSEGDSRFSDLEVTRCVLGVYRTASLPALHGSSHETSFAYALHFEARP